ncbi:hypothetical protein ACH4VM_29305 [Streptomyces sp. NPDC020792]|uniref:hypothetical protein n=1 Tax=Streptomyces sp. NPDC020792 TaxID=3365089 RepID=UPI0037B9B419
MKAGASFRRSCPDPHRNRSPTTRCTAQAAALLRDPDLVGAIADPHRAELVELLNVEGAELP